MRRIIPILAALLALTGPQGKAADELVAPTQQQLIELLSGNSMEGIWARRPYLQYFAADGSTRYREQGGEENEGLWRVNEQGQYCSRWPPSERWVCYDALVSGNNIYWKSGGEFYPAEVKPGKFF